MAIALGSIHKLRSRARERLGLSCGIRGNGWCVTHALLDEIPYQAYSLTEDVEFGVDLGLAGHRVAYCDEAHVNGEMVTTESAATQPAQRWEGGRFELIRGKVPALLRRAISGPSRVCLDLALDLLILPLSYIVLSAGALLVVGGRTRTLRIPRSGHSTLPLLVFDCAALAAYVGRGWALSGIGSARRAGTCYGCPASFCGNCCCWSPDPGPPPGSEPGARDPGTRLAAARSLKKHS